MKKNRLTDAQEIAYGGERVTHLYPNDCYYAHLSIYNHASSFALNKVVLDAGCGSGYGSYYLSQNGAKLVEAIDISEKAIEFCRKHFLKPNLHFHRMSLEAIRDYDESSFDLIFSSNVLEHIPDVGTFLLKAGRLLKPDGLLYMAVPPVVDKVSRRNNLDNRYHLNIWTPRQWYQVLSYYFREINCISHTFNNPAIKLDFNNTPEETKINEKSFTFTEVSLDEFYSQMPLTIIFLAKNPTRIESKPVFQFVEDSLTRPLIEPEREKFSVGTLVEKLSRKIRSLF